MGSDSAICLNQVRPRPQRVAGGEAAGIVAHQGRLVFNDQMARDALFQVSRSVIGKLRAQRHTLILESDDMTLLGPVE